jgi:hypothetical protein
MRKTCISTGKQGEEELRRIDHESQKADTLHLNLRNPILIK